MTPSARSPLFLKTEAPFVAGPEDLSDVASSSLGSLSNGGMKILPPRLAEWLNRSKNDGGGRGDGSGNWVEIGGIARPVRRW